MGEFIFWVILIPLLFYIIISIFSNENQFQDIEVDIKDNKYGDE